MGYSGIAKEVDLTTTNAKIDAVKIVVDFNAEDIATNLTNIVVNKTKIDTKPGVRGFTTSGLIQGPTNSTAWANVVNITGVKGIIHHIAGRSNIATGSIEMRITIDGTAYTFNTSSSPNTDKIVAFGISTGNMFGFFENEPTAGLGIHFDTSLKIEIRTPTASSGNYMVGNVIYSRE